MTIRFLNHSELDDVAELIKNNVSENHILVRERKLLAWQFPSTALSGPDNASILGYFENNQLIGMLGLIGHSFHVHGQVGSGHWTGNWFVHPEARSGSPGLQLLMHAKNLECDVLGVVGFNDLAHQFYKSLGFEFNLEIPRSVGVFDPINTLKILKDGTDDTKTLEPIIEHHVVKAEPMPEGWSCRLWDQDDDSWDHIWSSSIAPHLMGTYRDSQWIHWRYLDHPLVNYEVHVIVDPLGSIQGFSALRKEVIEGKHAVGRLVDAAATQEGSRALAYHLAEWGHDNSILYMDFVCSYQPLHEAFSEVGFASDQHNGQAYFPSRLQPINHQYIAIRAALIRSSKGRHHSLPLLHHPDFHVVRGDGDMDRPR